MRKELSDDKSVLDWRVIDTVLLDMDGTLLDLAFDNHFWSEHLPRRYAEHKAMPLETAHDHLAPIHESTSGTLDWYCVDYWSETLGVDVEALKHEVAERIVWLEGARAFLQAVRTAGKPLWLVTNAHPKSLSLKLACTDLGEFMDELISTHELGYAKEDARFWPQFARRFGLGQAQRALLVDDNLRVLAAAREYGIGHCVAVSRPDSSQPPREVQHDWPAVERLDELLQGLDPQDPG